MEFVVFKEYENCHFALKHNEEKEALVLFYCAAVLVLTESISPCSKIVSLFNSEYYGLFLLVISWFLELHCSCYDDQSVTLLKRLTCHRWNSQQAANTG